ncbi:hypothetical protein [Streptomyces hirsutus]|uniref:hypothetical protein n=1 Tax=Streptomyces hirsutus TaxID=35620 RepID=UPI003687677C
MPLLFIEVGNCTEGAVLIAAKFDKYARFFKRKEKDTDGIEKPLWRTRWSAPDPGFVHENGQQMLTTSGGTRVWCCSIARRLEEVGQPVLREVLEDRAHPRAANGW